MRKGYSRYKNWNDENDHTNISANEDWTLDLEFSGGELRRFDVKPLLDLEAFVELKIIEKFMKVKNCGYFIEWDNEADLSSDTLYLEGIPIPGLNC